MEPILFENIPENVKQALSLQPDKKYYISSEFISIPDYKCIGVITNKYYYEKIEPENKTGEIISDVVSDVAETIAETVETKKFNFISALLRIAKYIKLIR